MNFLAHLYLSFDEPALLIGNFITDFMKKPKEIAALAPEIRQGVALHHHIDRFTDTHPNVLDSKRRLYDRHGKYASVIVDIFYDYLLSKNWKTYQTESLQTFAQRTYAIFEAHKEALPPRVQPAVNNLIEYDWLTGYAAPDSLSYVFHRVAQRTSFSSNIAEAPKDLFKEEAAFNDDFQHFFPELLESCKQFVADL